MSLMRLDKFLSNMGVESRKGVRSYLRSGAVTVDGVVVKEHDMKVDTEKNTIKLYGEEIIYKKYIYLMMNKPSGVISATENHAQEETVIDLLPDEYLYYDPFPVGRLDKDTVGLLLLTNDGIFSHRTLSPKKHVEKEYYAKISGEVTEKDVSAFESGVKLDDGYMCKPAALKIINSSVNESEVKIIVTEGKFHQIKRMFESLNKTVTFLKRIRFDNIILDESLELGEVRELNEQEMAIIQKYVSPADS